MSHPTSVADYRLQMWGGLVLVLILGYGGYLPFALEVFAAWSLFQRTLRGRDRGWVRFTEPHGTFAGPRQGRGG